MQFFSKAKTLEYLSKKLKTAMVPKYYYFNVREYQKNEYKTIKNIQKIFKKKIRFQSC